MPIQTLATEDAMTEKSGERNEVLETAARAVATATGYHFSGDSILLSENPRNEHFVAVAVAVIKSLKELAMERTFDDAILQQILDTPDGDAVAGNWPPLVQSAIDER